jgi:ketosteroid isomerase-like protein
MEIPQVARDFADRINAHDTQGLIALMSPDHVLIDSLGNKFTRPAIAAGWAAYFAMVPDYRIRISTAPWLRATLWRFSARRAEPTSLNWVL